MKFDGRWARWMAAFALCSAGAAAHADPAFEKKPAIVLPPLPPAPVHLGKPSPAAEAIAPSSQAAPSLQAAPPPDARATGGGALPSAGAPAQAGQVRQPGAASPAAGPTAGAAPPPMETLVDEFAANAVRIGPALLSQTRAAIRAFYQSRNYAPVWLASDHWNAKARAAIRQMEGAGAEGLDPSRFDIPRLVSDSQRSLLKSDVALTIAVVLYGEQASGGQVAPQTVGPLIAPSAGMLTPTEILSRVATAADPAKALEALNPPQSAYRALKKKLTELRRARAAALAWLGRRDPRRRAEAGAPVVTPARFSPDFDFGAPVVGGELDSVALRDFQRLAGLRPNGRMTPQTAERLAGRQGVALESEIIANMQFWRWEPRHLGSQRIDVDIPDFMLTYYDDNRPVDTARVVVGKPATPTPIFSDLVRFVVINPTWRVPQSIIQKEMLPKLAADPDYFARNGLIARQVGNSISVEQPPGPRNALGRIKFLFPNDYAVYLHDTPDRYLFRYAARAYSHGCVRMQHPFTLGALTLGRQRDWSKMRLKKMIGYREHTFRLAAPIPIHMMYFTVFVDAEGHLQRRHDVYGYVRKAEYALRLPS